MGGGQTMKERILEDLKAFIEEEASVLYDDELNFNNADKTSQQRCWEQWQIEEMIKKVIKEDF